MESNVGSQSRFRFVMTDEVLRAEKKEWERLLGVKYITEEDLSKFISSFPGGVYNTAALRLRRHLSHSSSPKELR